MNITEQEVLNRIVTKLENVPVRNWRKSLVNGTDWETIRAFEVEIFNNNVESTWVILQKLSANVLKPEEFELRLINNDGESHRWWVFRKNSLEYNRMKIIVNQL